MTSVAHAVYRPVRAYDEQPESIVRTEHTQRSERERMKERDGTSPHYTIQCMA